MPFVYNRYLVALVVMGVLLAVFFLLLVYVVVFPFQDREEAVLNAENERQEANTAMENAYQSLDSVLEILGGEPGGGSVGRDNVQSITISWKRHINSDLILQKEYDSIASYVRALEAHTEDLKEKISNGEEEMREIGVPLEEMDTGMKKLFVVDIPDVERPQEVAEQIRTISEEIRRLRRAKKEAEMNSERYKKKKEEAETELEQIKQTRKGEIDKLNNALAEIRKECSKYEEKATSLELKLKDQQAQAQGKDNENDETGGGVIVVERFKATPDGEIFSVSGSGINTIGAVDIGREHKTRPGMIFEVFRGETTKGRIQLYKVDRYKSYFRVLELYNDNKNPILEGDKIHSPFYRRGVPTEFVVIGKFPPPLSRAKIVDRIERWEGTVKGKIGATTKYVVIGEGLLTEEERTAIQLYSVETITIAGLKEFLAEE